MSGISPHTCWISFITIALVTAFTMIVKAVTSLNQWMAGKHKFCKSVNMFLTFRVLFD